VTTRGRVLRQQAAGGAKHMDSHARRRPFALVAAFVALAAQFAAAQAPSWDCGGLATAAVGVPPRAGAESSGATDGKPLSSHLQGLGSVGGRVSRLANELIGTDGDARLGKIAVLDLTDINGECCALGRYVAEELTTALAAKGVQVVERSRLRQVLFDLSEFASPDSDTYLKIQQTLGADGVVVGTLTPHGTEIAVNARLVLTETGDVVAAASVELVLDGSLSGLLATPCGPAPAGTRLPSGGVSAGAAHGSSPGPLVQGLGSVGGRVSRLANDLIGTEGAARLQKIAVLDLTDINGECCTLGRYVAEELTTALATKGVQIVERGRLRQVLSDLSEFASPDPATYLRIQQELGADGVVVGTLTPHGTEIAVNARVVLTGTGDVVAAGSVELVLDGSLSGLLATPCGPAQSGARPPTQGAVPGGNR